MKFIVKNEKKDDIAKEMMGLFFEDINFAADGGLYAEMIENRSFEAKEGYGVPGGLYMVDDFGYGWSSYDGGCDKLPRMQFVSGTPLASENPHYLRFTAYEAGQGFKNKAYDGICIRKDAKYKVSFYARCVDYSGENINIFVEKDGKIYCEASVEAVKPLPYYPFQDLTMEFKSGDDKMDEKLAEIRAMDSSKLIPRNAWQKYEVELTAMADVRGASFVITLDKEGVVEFDLISMIPEDAVEGIFRKDLFEALKSITPGFIRFPGGCIIEGISLPNRYQWKNTVGPVEHRTYIQNLWAFYDDRSKTDLDVQRDDSHYGQSYGIGFYEYFLLCELLGAKPLPVLNVGLACQFRSTEMVAIDSDEFEEYIQDALDLIDFAKGSVDTKWGKLRAKMGHPEPFNLEMIGIGNEQWETTNVDFFARYERFEKAIHEKDDSIKLIGSAGPHVDMPTAKLAWEIHNEKVKENKDYAYAVDEHYYVSPEWLYDRIDLYNDYSRDVAVFAGEYAAHPEGKENTMEGALAEAAFLTGIEKNAGVVKLASYAPLFNRIGHSQWTPDMIWFDDKDVYLTPSYYVQKMYGNNVGDYTVSMDGQDVELRKEKIYISVSKTNDNDIIIKVVNNNNKEYILELENEDGSNLVGEGTISVLVSAGEKKEKMPEPSELKKEDISIDGSVILKSMSFSVINIKCN